MQECWWPTLLNLSQNAYESDLDATDSPIAGDDSDNQSGGSEDPPTPGAKTKSAARTEAEKTEARSAAAKKATATRAANHQAFVDKITAELAKAQRQMLVGTVAYGSGFHRIAHS